jgi:Chaperone of endosialidase
MKKICLLLSFIVIFIGAHAQAPVNDEPCGAIDVPVQPGEPLLVVCAPTTVYTYANATLTAAIPNPTCVGITSGIKDVWYKFTVPASGTCVISTGLANSNNNIVMTAYTATACNGTFTEINCNDDNDSIFPTMVTFATSGEIIYIRIFMLNETAAANFKMCVADYSINNNPIVDNTTKIGIGTINPVTKLDVAGTGLFRDQVTFVKDVELRSGLKLAVNAGANKILISDANGNASWQLPVVQPNYWSLSGSDIYNNTNNVGINLVNPTEKVHVDGNIKLGNIPWSSVVNDRVIKFGDANYITIGERFLDDQLHINGNQGIVFRTSGDGERMRLNFLGNLGIGTGSPTNKLTVSGNADFTGNVGIGLTNPTYKLHLGNTNNGLRIEGPATAGSGGSALNIGGFGDVIIDKPGTVAGRLAIKENGDVGIGSAIPSAYGHGGTNRVLELRNFAPASINIQSHLILSSTGNAGSLGGVTWASTSLSGEQRTGFIGNAFEATNRTRVSFYARNDAGLLSEKFYVSGDGSAWLAGALTQNSDIRLKKNIEPLHLSLNKLTQLNGYSYNWINTDNDQSEQIGLIAQEVQKLYPQLVTEIKKENGETSLGVNYTGLIPVMIESIKEQQKQIEEQNKITAVQQKQIDELKLLVQKLLNK